MRYPRRYRPRLRERTREVFIEQYPLTPPVPHFEPHEIALLEQEMAHAYQYSQEGAGEQDERPEEDAQHYSDAAKEDQIRG